MIWMIRRWALAWSWRAHFAWERAKVQNARWNYQRLARRHIWGVWGHGGCLPHTHTYIYIYGWIWSRVPCSYRPPNGMGPQVAPPFPSICKLLAAFLRSSLAFARFLQRFWLPASHLRGTCYLLDDLRSSHTPSKYLRATYSHIYMCYVSTSYIYIYIHNIYIYT